MPNDPFVHRFALVRTSSTAWDIIDRSVEPPDDHHVVARVREEEAAAGVTVRWELPVPLLDAYLNPEAVLDDLARWNTRREGWSRPVPIPHLPPPKS